MVVSQLTEAKGGKDMLKEHKEILSQTAYDMAYNFEKTYHG
jgi:hypothetical protein